MTTTFFIPIKSMNLAHYLSNGIIAPANYIENRNQDLQNRFINNLLLSTSKFTVDTNCSLEIVLNEKEEVPKRISDNFFLFNMPLPISRIKAIYFTDVEQKINTVFNITSGAAFIPDNILLISDEKPISTGEIDNVLNIPTEVNWKHYLKKYDQLLGGFALMKIGKEDFQNYPTHYFKSLGNINNYFNTILSEQNIEIENIFEFAFTDNGRFKSFHETIYSEITIEVVERYARKDNIKIEIRNGLILVDKIPEDTHTYLVSILDSYGQGKRKQTDSFISDLVSDKFNKKKKEGLSLIFGINKGYSSFRNKYKTENFETVIKFKLDCKLDYYVIESVYQKVFNNQVVTSIYSFIDNWCISLVDQEIVKSKFTTYKVLDKIIIFKKKDDLFLELFRSSSDRRSKIFEIISKNISKHLPKYLKLDPDLFKEQLVDECEQFFKDYSQFIVVETQKIALLENELYTNSFKNKIANLTNQIENQKNEIENLREKLNMHNSISRSGIIPDEKNENKSIEQEFIEVKEAIQFNFNTKEFSNINNKDNFEVDIENQNLSESSNEIKDVIQKDDEINEVEKKYNKNFSDSIFSDENIEVKRSSREKELRALKICNLKIIAATLKILTHSSSKKDNIIADILRVEFSL